MSEQKKPQLSEHIRQRTQEWLRKAEHELAYLIEEAKAAIEMAKQIYKFTLNKVNALGYDDN